MLFQATLSIRQCKYTTLFTARTIPTIVSPGIPQTPYYLDTYANRHASGIPDAT